MIAVAFWLVWPPLTLLVLPTLCSGLSGPLLGHVCLFDRPPSVTFSAQRNFKIWCFVAIGWSWGIWELPAFIAPKYPRKGLVTESGRPRVWLSKASIAIPSGSCCPVLLMPSLKGLLLSLCGHLLVGDRL